MRPAFLIPLMLMSPAAAEVLPLPANCQGVVTVQMSFCTVANIWNCEVDGQREVWTYNYGEGANMVFRRDTDGQQLGAFSVTDSGTTSALPVVSVADPVSIRDLVAAGQDSFAMTSRILDGSTSDAAGTMHVMGEPITVDGWQLVPVFAEYSNPAPGLAGYYFLMDAARGIMFHTYFAEPGALDRPIPQAALPVTVAFAGDDGFLASEPSVGCGG